MVWSAMTGGHRVAFLAGAATVFGALGPWEGVVGVAAWGYEGPGWLIAVPAALAMVALVAVRAPRVRAWLAGLGMGVAAYWALVGFMQMAPPVPDPDRFWMSWGLPLALATSLIGLVAVLMGNVAEAEQRRKRTAGA